MFPPQFSKLLHHTLSKVKVKASQQAMKAPRGVKAPSFRDIGTVMVVGCQPYTPAAFTPGAFLMTGNTPGTHFC